MKYIMVIDDSPTIRTSVEYTIKELGHEVKHAENGVDALEKIKELKKNGDDILLCMVDINMPEMDGISFIKEFRKFDKFTPVIVLTTESEESKMMEGKDAGASGWIVKPFQPGELVKTVSRLVK